MTVVVRVAIGCGNGDGLALFFSCSLDLKFAFQLREADQPGIIFFTLSPPEKNEWMAALTLLLTRRCGWCPC